ncbi:MAG: purine-nucleoside phosphorylase [Myxococcales bacterium]|nr:purine-nucleoside phosphorylase [Myxococcales bacterium]
MTTTSGANRWEAAVEALRARDARVPEVGLVLGSGLGAFADTLVDATVIPFSEVPGMGSVTVPGHAGKLVVGRLPGEGPSPVVAALAGRIHLYEGHSADEVVFNVRTLAQWGVKQFVLTNAAGGISPTLRPGDLVLISDHLNFQLRSPLTGPNDPTLGPRFPDMTRVYDPGLRQIASEVALTQGFALREGVYGGVLGPQYETPAEIKMLRTMGADLVGMSTVSEAIALRHMGRKVLGISCVTNLASGVSPVELSHAEVEETARATRERFVGLLTGILRRLAA